MINPYKKLQDRMGWSDKDLLTHLITYSMCKGRQFEVEEFLEKVANTHKILKKEIARKL